MGLYAVCALARDSELNQLRALASMCRRDVLDVEDVGVLLINSR
jgi:hypothetical protein